MQDTNFSQSRRNLMGAGGAAIAAAFGGPIAAMAAGACVPGVASTLVTSPYGPIAPTGDISTGLPLIQLPKGFSYKSYGWRGDLMADGLVTPAAHDGMGVVRSRRVGRSLEIVLVRNHEQSTSANAADVIGGTLASVAKYDTGRIGARYPSGGTTNLVWRDGDWIESFASLGGLQAPCAGGATGWESWLANEEVRGNAVSSAGKHHGYIFEVPAAPGTTPVNAKPIIAMGRMAHEASAIDPQSGIWYLTEDQFDANTLYRFLPTTSGGGYGSLHGGGRLQGLRVRGVANADLRFPTLCQEYRIEWVDITEPDLDGGALAIAGVGHAIAASGPYRQAYANGAAIFGANEGCWVAAGTVYFTDKHVVSSPRRCGRIWALDIATSTLKAIFVSDDITVGNSPDNLCVSPRGGVLFNEDGSSSGTNAAGHTVQVPAQRLMGLRGDGKSYVFASNNLDLSATQLAAAGKPRAPSGNQRNTEWAGSCFSPDGSVLFVNLYAGVTLAISGPWERGTL